MKIELYTTYTIIDGAETKVIETCWMQDAIDAADRAQAQHPTARVVVVKWLQNLMIDTVVYEATSVQAEPVKTTSAIDNTEIKYDRITKDYAILVDGRVIGYGRNYSEAEANRTAYLAERAEELTNACGGFGCVDGCGDCEPKIMTTNEMIAAVKALKVGDDVTINGFTVVKYGRKNYHIFLGAAYTSPTAFGSLSDPYTVAIKIGTKTSKSMQVAA